MPLRARAQQVQALLTAQQLPDGTWPDPPGGNEDRFGAGYRTAMAVIALCAR